MLTEEPRLYLGMELNADYAMISSAMLSRPEPETISRITGSEMYQIPVALAKRRGIGQWFYGDEAERLKKEREVIVVDDLLRKALAGQEITVEDESYPAEELLALFVRKVLTLPRRLGNHFEIEKLVVTMPELSEDAVRVMKLVLRENALRDGQFLLVDNRESFYYYALSQPEELYLHDVALFDYTSGTLRFACLSRNERTEPQTIRLYMSKIVSPPPSSTPLIVTVLTQRPII